MIRLKHSVNPIGVRAEMILGLMVAEDVYTDYGHECVVTSLNDSTHSKTSRHYQGMAADLRTRHLPSDGVAKNITDEIRKRLGRHYLVIFEHNHIHIGYQPQKR